MENTGGIIKLATKPTKSKWSVKSVLKATALPSLPEDSCCRGKFTKIYHTRDQHFTGGAGEQQNLKVSVGTCLKNLNQITIT